jgi:hypothetical protein
MRADVHGGPEHTRSNQRPDTFDARPQTDRSIKPLATHGRTIHWVKGSKTLREYMFSESPPIADIVRSVRTSKARQKPHFEGERIAGRIRASHRKALLGRMIERRASLHGRHSARGPEFYKIFYEALPLTDGPRSRTAGRLHRHHKGGVSSVFPSGRGH